MTRATAPRASHQDRHLGGLLREIPPSHAGLKYRGRVGAMTGEEIHASQGGAAGAGTDRRRIATMLITEESCT